MTGNPAAPRTGGGRNRPASYDRGIDPAVIRHPASRVGGPEGTYPPPPPGPPSRPETRCFRTFAKPAGPGPEARATRPTERHADVPPPMVFLFCRSAKALDHIGVAEPVKPAAHGPKGPGRRV